MEEQVLLHIWRPEASDNSKGSLNPFEGVETYLMESDRAAEQLANFLADKHPTWQFYIDTAFKWEGATP